MADYWSETIACGSRQRGAISVFEDSSDFAQPTGSHDKEHKRHIDKVRSDLS